MINLSKEHSKLLPQLYPREYEAYLDMIGKCYDPSIPITPNMEPRAPKFARHGRRRPNAGLNRNAKAPRAFDALAGVFTLKSQQNAFLPDGPDQEMASPCEDHIPMIPLPTTFRSRGFEFEQLAREGNVALFRKTKLCKRPGGNIEFETFEVVVVQEMEEHQWPDGRIEPAHEHMPGSEQWGIAGWSLQNSERAWVKFRELRDKQEDREEKAQQTSARLP